MQTPLDSMRSKLRVELDTLLDRHGRISAHLHNADREVPADWPERAQLFENDTVLEALDGRTRARIVQIRLALERLNDPAWGFCARCGEPIRPARLAALPTTTVCVSCAERFQ